jgi:hypothetical protein
LRKDGWRPVGIRWLLFFAGIFLISLGIALMLRTRLGLSPWDVFHQGLTYHTPLTMGQAMQLTGGVLILISWILGYGPGLGTIINMLGIGLFFRPAGGAHPGPGRVMAQAGDFLLGSGSIWFRIGLVYCL